MQSLHYRECIMTYPNIHLLLTVDGLIGLVRNKNKKKKKGKVVYISSQCLFVFFFLIKNVNYYRLITPIHKKMNIFFINHNKFKKIWFIDIKTWLWKYKCFQNILISLNVIREYFNWNTSPKSLTIIWIMTYFQYRYYCLITKYYLNNKTNNTGINQYEFVSMYKK